jgi:DnaJ-class molecular chaperone
MSDDECRCVQCPDCRGLGTVRRYDKSQPSGWDLDTCEECRGSGVIEECERCLMLEEMAEDEYEQER